MGDEMVLIRFIKQGANSMLGGFSSGDTARVGEDFARHLVEEAQVAEYVTTSHKDEAPQVEPAKKRGRAKG